MKKLLLAAVMLICAHSGFGQAYIPMPSDSAVWRYRFYDVDFITQVMDNILFITGEDTVYAGKTYHKVFSRYHNIFQDDTAGPPPIVPVEADRPDMYYGAYREEDKKIYYLSYAHEDIIYDYNAAVGSLIPAWAGMDTVMSIDSVLLADGYHKRFNTNEAFFSPIEGIGSSAGLLPQLVDGTDNNQFFCYARATVTYAPPSASMVPCTSISPFFSSQLLAGNVFNTTNGIVAYPVPATDLLHIVPYMHSTTTVSIVDGIGKMVWTEKISSPQDIDVNKWPKGLYVIKWIDQNLNFANQKIIVR